MKVAGERSKAFLTGGSGFLGPLVTAALEIQGFQVFSSATQLNDLKTLRTELESDTWDIIFHLAGLSLPAECERNPLLAYEINLCGTIDFASLCAQIKTQALFVFFSTAYVYSPKLEDRLTEKSLTDPATVYGRTKLFAENFLKDIAPVSGFPVLALRLFNHSHKSQRSDFFLPAMFKTISSAGKSNSPIQVPIGDPTLLRDFSTMQDFTSVIEAIARNHERLARTIQTDTCSFQACNLSSGKPRELGKLVHLLAKKMGVSISLQPDQSRMRPGEPKKVYGDPQMLHELLNYDPPIRSDEEFIEHFLKDLA